MVVIQIELLVVDSNGNIIAKVNKDGVTSVNFISNEYDINNKLNSLTSELENEINERISQDKEYYQKHINELDTHIVQNTQEHTTLQKNIDSNTTLINNTENNLLNKIKYYENEGINGSDILYIVDGNGHKIAQFDKNGLITTYIQAEDYTAGNGFTFSRAIFYNLQGSIDAFPDNT